VNCTEIPRILEELPSGTACKRVAERFPDCRCECESVCPDLSPGIVENGETLARFVPLKDLDLETSTVKASLFDKATRNGMSVTRVEMASRETPVQRQKDKRFCGFVTATCGDIRAKMEDGKRLFSVYDTALETNTCHADVCAAVATEGPSKIKLRLTLLETFARVISNFVEDEAASDSGSTAG
jgi:hypothetical protein